MRRLPGRLLLAMDSRSAGAFASSAKPSSSPSFEPSATLGTCDSPASVALSSLGCALCECSSCNTCQTDLALKHPRCAGLPQSGCDPEISVHRLKRGDAEVCGNGQCHWAGAMHCPSTFCCCWSSVRSRAPPASMLALGAKLCRAARRRPKCPLGGRAAPPPPAPTPARTRSE